MVRVGVLLQAILMTKTTMTAHCAKLKNMLIGQAYARFPISSMVLQMSEPRLLYEVVSSVIKCGECDVEKTEHMM